MNRKNEVNVVRVINSRVNKMEIAMETFFIRSDSKCMFSKGVFCNARFNIQGLLHVCVFIGILQGMLI